MRLIPVLDVKAGQAVHARAGLRDHYRPVSSKLHPGSDPVGLGCAYVEKLGAREIYVADLDAIGGCSPNLALVRALSELGAQVWLDAGLRDRGGLETLRDSDAGVLVAGLETLAGPDALADMLDVLGPARLAFSLDLRAGEPLVAGGADWGTSDPLRLAERALALGLRRVIILDLAHVGSSAGPAPRAVELLRHLASSHPDTDWIIGGGVSGPADLSLLEQAGASAVLLASALHDSRIGAEFFP